MRHWRHAAATTGEKDEQAVLSDAAKRLGVSPGDLESALGKAEDAQLDQAVKDGRPDPAAGG